VPQTILAKRCIKVALSGLSVLFASKTIRVFVFGTVTVLTPVYLSLMGYSSLYVGLALMVIVIGNALSNTFLTWYGNAFGRKRTLLLFSSLMAISGGILFISRSFPLIIVALLIGNISTTGTEAGPFQSIESGVLPKLTSDAGRGRAFGMYNMLGYSASAIGALAATIPSFFGGAMPVFRYLYLIYGFVGISLFLLYRRLPEIEAVKRGVGFRNISTKARREIKKLSALFSMDALGGGFVTQSLITYWFFIVYHVSLQSLGLIFFFVNVITALSIYGASLMAERLGNLRTMVYTHLLSNVFLILIPISGSLELGLMFLFLRQSVSQMDVPTRQAFMAQIFDDDDRVSANAITNTFRSASAIIGAPIAGLALAQALFSLPFLVGGSSKVAYDLSIFAAYRKKVK